MNNADENRLPGEEKLVLLNHIMHSNILKIRSCQASIK
jgi:hypothetical protein